jgi:proteasome accessory factor C
MAGDDAKLERITDLIFALLDASQPIPLSRLCEEIPGYPEGHEARRQAFERDKRLLREEGIVVESLPIDGPDQIGYRIDPATFFLPDLDLDLDEEAALNLAVAGVHVSDDSGGDALRKLGMVELFDVQPVATLGVVPGLDRLFQAIATAAEVRFSYRGEQRNVAPARLRFVDGNWYLAGWSREREAGRNFRVDRIGGPISLGVPGSGVVDEEQRIELVLPDGDWERDADDASRSILRLRVDPIYAWKVIADVGEHRVTSRGDDGSVIVEVDLTQELIARSWVVSLLDHVEVLEPPEFRGSVISWLESVAEQTLPVGPAPSIEELIAATKPRSGSDRAVPPAQKRVRRLLAMLEWLASVGSAPTSAVAERFSMTEDEVVAELELAACCGRPPYSPGELMDIIVDPEEVSARLPEMSRPRQLTPAEGVAVAAAARTILAMPGADPRGPLARAVHKLEEALGRRPAIEVEIENPPLLDQIRAAVDSGRQLEVEYLSRSNDEVTTRVIDPYRVSAVGGHWYVQAFCHRAGEDRTFRADSFKSVRELGLQSRHEPRLDEDPESFVPSAESDVVILRVGEEALWVADSIPIVARRDESDGGATIGLMVSGAAWFERILLQGGPAIQVLSPRKWIETGHRAAERVLDRYR